MGMGNFQPQNYGEDFNRSMIGMGNFVSGLQKANDDRAQRAIDNERNQVADERAGRATDTTIAHNEAATAKLQREVANEKLLQDITPIWAKQGKNLDDNELATLAQFNINFPAVPNSLESIPQFEEAHGNLMQATEFIKTQLPPSDKPYSIDPGMTPETDAALKSLQTVFSSDRFKKFVDADGSITGTKGAVYHTENNPSLIVNKPADGAASVVVRFPIVDDNGNPIFKKDANGNDTAERVLRPSTMGQSNDGNDRVNFIPVDMLQAKSAAALQQMAAVKNLDPEQLTKLTTLMYSLRPDGVKEMMAAQTKDNTPIIVNKGGKAFKKDGSLLASNPESASDKAPDVKTGGVAGKPGYEQNYQWNPETGRYDIPVGSPMLKHAPAAGNGNGNGSGKLSSADEKNLTARNALVARLVTLEVGKPTVDPDTGATVIATQGTRQRYVDAINRYDKMMEGKVTPFLPADTAEPELSSAVAWLQEEEKNKKLDDGEVKKSLKRAKYTDEQANRIIALARGGNSGAMSPSAIVKNPQPQNNKYTTSALPAGAVSAGMTKDGRPVYRLPNGKLVAGNTP